jgi:hypothetical protein
VGLRAHARQAGTYTLTRTQPGAVMHDNHARHGPAAEGTVTPAGIPHTECGSSHPSSPLSTGTSGHGLMLPAARPGRQQPRWGGAGLAPGLGVRSIRARSRPSGGCAGRRARLGDCTVYPPRRCVTGRPGQLWEARTPVAVAGAASRPKDVKNGAGHGEVVQRRQGLRLHRG